MGIAGEATACPRSRSTGRWFSQVNEGSERAEATGHKAGLMDSECSAASSETAPGRNERRGEADGRKDGTGRRREAVQKQAGVAWAGTVLVL